VRYNCALDYFVIGTNVGLKVYDKGIIRSIDVKELAGKEISSVDWLDKNTLAIGTFEDGLFIYSFETNTIKHVNRTNGLVSNIIFFLFQDDSGIWVGTEKGIDLVRYDLPTGKVSSINHYDDSDGLFGLETNSNAVIKKDSVLFFGLVKGLYSYKSHQTAQVENKLHLKGVNLFYKPFNDPKLFENGSSSTYSFKHDQNHLTFLFNKVNKRKPAKYFYTYRLNEFDQIWSQPSQLNGITYSNLPPGTYALEVRATDKAGAFVFDRISFHFKILPAYYQTIYFKAFLVLLAGLFVLSATFLVYRFRANRALALQTMQDDEKARIRKEIARDFHDELGNQVARMINYVSLLRISEKMEKDIYQALNTYSQTILNGTKDFVWSLDPKNDDLGSVLIHLKDFGERMFSEKNIQFSFYGDLLTARLPMGYGRQINLIFKEAMTNAFKHADAKSVDLVLVSTSAKNLTISLKDDGKGMGKSEIQNSERGIENMRTRAQKINSYISFQSNESGTEVKLIVAVPERMV
jgi:signal transduction histidine kinase